MSDKTQFLFSKPYSLVREIEKEIALLGRNTIRKAKARKELNCPRLNGKTGWQSPIVEEKRDRRVHRLLFKSFIDPLHWE